MDEKVFELMEKMYSEMQEMKSNMATKYDLADMVTKDDLLKVEQKLIIMENKMDQNHKVLYDGYKLTFEKLETLEVKVNEIENKVERQDVEIRVIRSAI